LFASILSGHDIVAAARKASGSSLPLEAPETALAYREAVMWVWPAVIILAAGLMAGEAPGWAAPAGQGSIEQRSEGACSPPIFNNSGQVSINCPGVDEKALHYLESQLSEQFHRLSEQLHSLNDSQRTIRNLNDLNDTLRQQADDWARRYRELSA
jgi:hypothetical protein